MSSSSPHSSSGSESDSDDAPVEISTSTAKQSFSDLRAAEDSAQVGLQEKRQQLKAKQTARQVQYAREAAEKKKQDLSFLEDVDTLLQERDSKEESARQESEAQEAQFQEAQERAKAVSKRHTVLYGDEVVKKHEGGFTVHMSADAAATASSSTQSTSASSSTSPTSSISSSKAAKHRRKRQRTAMLLSSAFAGTNASVADVLGKLHKKHARIDSASHINKKVKSNRHSRRS
jgi:type IV secretory pathway VirJ component